MPERDPAVDTLRVQAALAAERLHRSGLPTATALLETRAEAATALGPTLAPAATRGQLVPRRLEGRPEDEVPTNAANAPVLTRILQGDHQALFATTAALAGADAAERRPWHATLLALVAVVAERAIDAGWLDVPVGNPFWDTFTLSQCRQIAAALATTGYRFDGFDGWADGRVPTYRDLTLAVASAGLEPRRIRAWPTQEGIAGLYREVTVATDDFLATHAPGLDLDELQAVVGAGGPDLARLWRSWDRVRTILMEPAAAA